MAVYIKGNVVDNAEKYVLFRKNGNTYISLAETSTNSSTFEFNLTELRKTGKIPTDGTYTFVVQARAADYENSEYSNEQTWTFGSSTPVYTLKINPIPASATVTMNGMVQKEITVEQGTSVNWRVAATGYVAQSDVWTADADEELNITLVAESGDEPVNPPPSESNYTLIHGNKYASGNESNTARASISPLTIIVPKGVTITNKSTIKWAYYTGVNTNNMPSGTGVGAWGDYNYTGTGAAIGIALKKANDQVFDWSVDSTNPADYFDVSDPGLWNGTATEAPGSGSGGGSSSGTPSGSIGDITALTLVDGNPWGTAEQQTAKNRVHSSTALYCPAGTTISCKNTTTYKWAVRKVTSDTNLTSTESSYRPDSAWTTKTSYTTTDNGYWCFILVKASNADFNWSTDSNKVSDYFTVS